MDPVATARVPAEVRTWGNAILKGIGSSPSELINSTYEYVIRGKRLPQTEGSEEGGIRVLEGLCAEALDSYMKGIHVDCAQDRDDASFEALFRQAVNAHD